MPTTRCHATSPSAVTAKVATPVCVHNMLLCCLSSSSSSAAHSLCQENTSDAGTSTDVTQPLCSSCPLQLHIHIGPINFASGSFGSTYLTTASPSSCQFTEECPPLDATIPTNFWDPNNTGGRGRTIGKWIKVSQPGSPRYIMKYEDRADITQVSVVGVEEERGGGRGEPTAAVTRRCGRGEVQH